LRIEGDFGLGLGRNHRRGDDRLALVVDHVRQQLAEIGLVDLEHVHDDLAGHADLLADHGVAVVELALDHAQLDVVGILDGDVAFAVGQRGDRGEGLERGVQLVAVVIDLVLVHVSCSLRCVRLMCR